MIFTKLDLCLEYNNVYIKKSDKWKTAFTLPKGFYKPIVIFFGLINLPATFSVNDEYSQIIQENSMEFLLQASLSYIL